MTSKRQKIANPNMVYTTPAQIVEDDSLSKDEKLKALDSLEYDCNQLLVAADERLNGGEQPVKISDIHLARERLTGVKASLDSTNNSKTSI